MAHFGDVVPNLPTVLFDHPALVGRVNSAVSSMRSFFRLHFHVEVDITVLFTAEGHFSLSYCLQDPQTEEEVWGEASFTDHQHLREAVKLHLLGLLQYMTRPFPQCSTCALPHKNLRCPRVPEIDEQVPYVKIQHKPPQRSFAKTKDKIQQK